MTTHAPKLQTLQELRELQRLAAAVIMRPLSPQWRAQRRWIDGRDMHAVSSQFIKPNDRLSSLERIEIYNRQYWFRLIDSFYDDFPGLRAVLGRLKFNRLAKAFLSEHPSRSFTLRNLGRRLPQFIAEHPSFVSPRFELAQDMALFEWAQIEAFDGPAHPPLSVDDLLGRDPVKLRLALQPYLTLLELRYPLDDYLLRMKRDASRRDASNAVDDISTEPRRARRSTPIPRRKHIFVAVHRLADTLYYKRLDEPAYRLLTALRAGKSLDGALRRAFPARTDAECVQDWFQTWTELGWFCKRKTA